MFSSFDSIAKKSHFRQNFYFCSKKTDEPLSQIRLFFIVRFSQIPFDCLLQGCYCAAVGVIDETTHCLTMQNFHQLSNAGQIFVAFFYYNYVARMF